MNQPKTPEEIEQERILHKKHAKGKISSMHRRCDFHDYKGKGSYMFTICTSPRRQVFGRLIVPEGFRSAVNGFSTEVGRTSCSAVAHQAVTEKRTSLPYIQLSAVGEMIKAQWEDIPFEYPQIENLLIQVMPDHVHGLLRVRSPLPMSVGLIIGRFKYLTTKKYNQILNGEDFIQRGVATETLWESNYADSIVTSEERRNTLVAYILDNPRRLALKTLMPEYLAVSKTEIAGYEFSCVGNLKLLQCRPLLQLRLSRNLTDEAIKTVKSECHKKADGGAVFVSPCISKGEKTVTRSLFDKGYPLVVLLENGFTDYYKPPASYLDAFTGGRILFLAPWPHHNEKRTITREQCLALNQMAEDICNLSGNRIS